ncbi:RagB/SusD family nutrient uptake outer membrane protein [Paraflavitalea soli]|uniref:RagB/SusD family nutrient uptake outer membrane protein n=1 Tax=Paraflavitalea soli TaxID=2315862 RepID=A0A3B7MMI0_9BACT|nr:RagB/SusD family nutrient uptake outer membrane protein [Paraflavitalea soli]AXY75662.1 RagB/SusD family nutrient uptake outer membrane protein [Paraflavitalea soli]
MKNKTITTIFSSIALAGVLATASCKKYLDVENPSTISQDAVFESVSYTTSAVVGVYNKLMGDNGYGSRISLLYPMAADDFKTSGDFNPLDRRGLSGYGASPDNTELDAPFSQLYQGIERANICIKYIPLSGLYTKGSEADKKIMRKLYGEVLTLRAQFYYELIRNWGDLPAQFQPSADIPNLFLPKSDRDSIYNILLADLKTASDLVPWRSESGDPSTRVTKAVVKGLRARIALARGGYSLRRSPQEMIRKADYKEYYKIAMDECADIIASKEHGLNPSYENLFRTIHNSTRLDPNNEWIFEAGAFGGNARTDSKLGYSNGIRINGSSSYGVANGGVVGIPTYFYEFDSVGDCRRDVTLAWFEIDGANNKVVTNFNDMRDGKYRKYWTSINGTNQNLGINWPLLRYADVLLMYAEADNELGSAPSAKAIAAYEEVRKRAFTGFESRMGTTPTDKDGFFKAIVKERLLEFGGEGIRKYDLIRWNLLATVIDQTRANLRELMNGTGRYANVPKYVYIKANKVLNKTVPEETLDFDVYGGPVSKSMFTLDPVASTPDGYVRKNWRVAVNEEYITGQFQGFALKFEKNKKELFPLYSGVLNQNYNLKQDYGY